MLEAKNSCVALGGHTMIEYLNWLIGYRPGGLKGDNHSI